MRYAINKFVVFFIGFGISFIPLSIGYAEDAAIITIKNHSFVPAELTVPSGKKIKLTIQNQDTTPEEFESYDLNREEVIEGGQSFEIFIGPLKPGKYTYFGEFNPDTAQGTIIAQ